MKVEELRIGNYVKFAHYEPHKLQRKEFKYTEGYANIEEYKPIPLTEEWLIKFGFKKYEGDSDYDSIYEYNNKKSIMPKTGYFEFAVGFIEDEISIFLYSGDCLKHINTVHQLQNLYFALCNEELTIKT